MAPETVDKILIALTFWEGDKKAAMQLARFLADLEPEHSKKADLLLVKRFDCSGDSEIIPYVSRKFNVHSWTSTRKNTGWPDGCNDLWLSMMDWVWSMRAADRIPRYKAIFNCEADGAPLSANWISLMSEAWDKANCVQPVVMAGPLVALPREHINANALLSGDLNFLTWVARRLNLRVRGGWDFVLASEFKRRGWANIPGMRSYWNTKTCLEQEYLDLQKQDVFWVHGVKDDSMLRWGRKYLFNAPE